MTDLPSIFLSIANKVTSAMGAPFFDGLILDESPAVFDDGGSIIAPGTPTQRSCRVQIDAATDYMRAALGYTEQDVVFVVLARSFTGELDTDARIQITSGPRAGLWTVSEISRDPAGIGYSGKARKQ